MAKSVTSQKSVQVFAHFILTERKMMSKSFVDHCFRQKWCACSHANHLFNELFGPFMQPARLAGKLFRNRTRALSSR
jgi:hypothetical protein